MRERCEVVAYVRSRRAAVESYRVLVPVPVPIGTSVAVVSHARRVVRYARVLDPAQADVVAETRRLAADLGESIRVVDLGRAHPVVRALRSLFLGAGAFPVVVWRGPCFRAPSGHRMRGRLSTPTG